MDCQHCKKAYFVICLNGVLWLCWDCYIAECQKDETT